MRLFARRSSMSIRLKKHDEELIREKVASGLYSDAEEALHEAVTLLDERDRKIEWLRSAIEAGRSDFTNGDFEEWTPELMERLLNQSDRELIDSVSERHAASA